jgi:hypothetical protein
MNATRGVPAQQEISPTWAKKLTRDTLELFRDLALLLLRKDLFMRALPVDPECRIHLVNRDKLGGPWDGPKGSYITNPHRHQYSVAGLPPMFFSPQNAAYATTRILRITRIRIPIQIRILCVLYACKYAYYTYPYPDTEYDGSNPTQFNDFFLDGIRTEIGTCSFFMTFE